MFNAVHLTTETVQKLSGVGTVLEGLINCRPYRDGVGRTLLIGPLLNPDDPWRLGPQGSLEYSSLDGLFGSPYADAFRAVETTYGVNICYGYRPIEDSGSDRRTLGEVLLIDARHINSAAVNALKGRLWEEFSLASLRFEHLHDYELSVRCAVPVTALLAAARVATREQPAVVFAHDVAAMPAALALMSEDPTRYRTLYYAHEVPTIRRIVEHHPGHDVMFHALLPRARAAGLFIDQIFGAQSDYHKHALLEASRFCDGILAVGNHVRHELEFLDPRFADADISVAFNGIPAREVTHEEREDSRARVRTYLATLLGWAPDLLFTHVTRLQVSKALWRDLDVLAALDVELGRQRRTAVHFVLSSEAPRRPSAEVRRMEREWDWPLAHREGQGDLTPAEAEFYAAVQVFNARARNVRVLYVNQFGFDAAGCGARVPEDLTLVDLRRASSAEFGFSLYEPFGLSPFEPLTYGAIAALSASCGCAGFYAQAAGTRECPNVIVADYADDAGHPTIKDALAVGRVERRAIERRVAERVARELLARLPADEAQERALLKSGHALARKMNWDVVGERYVFPAVRRALARRRMFKLATG